MLWVGWVLWSYDWADCLINFLSVFVCAARRLIDIRYSTGFKDKDTFGSKAAVTTAPNLSSLWGGSELGREDGREEFWAAFSWRAFGVSRQQHTSGCRNPHGWSQSQACTARRRLWGLHLFNLLCWKEIQTGKMQKRKEKKNQSPTIH